jgi:fatty acid desaturase
MMNCEILKKALKQKILWVAEAILLSLFAVITALLGYFDWLICAIFSVSILFNFAITYYNTFLQHHHEKFMEAYDKAINKTLERYKLLEKQVEESEKEADKMCKLYKKNKDGNNEN